MDEARKEILVWREHYKRKEEAKKQASKPLTHEQAKALAERCGNDPLNLIFQTEKHHGITGEEV